MSSSSALFSADQVRDRLAAFEPVSLETVGPSASRDRCDTKFLLSQDQLLAVLGGLHEHYSALEVGGARLHRYRTLYFDTAGFDLYRRHQRSSRSALKIRSRHYVDSGRSFFELKRKVGPRRSLKARTETPAIVTELTAAQGAFIAAHAPINSECLRPTLWNRFERITLVSKKSRERVTLDLGVQFEWQPSEVHLSGVVVGELKQERFNRASAFFWHMRSIGSRPTGFSKYCVGAALLHPQLKSNRARPKLRMLAKLAHA